MLGEFFFRENPALKPPAARIHPHFRDGNPLIGGRSFSQLRRAHEGGPGASEIRLRNGNRGILIFRE